MDTPAGLVVVDKPSGLTSHDVVARVRRMAGTRKVGHAGTLDPMATGVLVVGVGRATRLLGQLQLSDKTYRAVIRLGMSTTTDDAEGESLKICDASAVSEDRVLRGLAAMVGEIAQVPSAVSAVKVNGQRAYARVRAGEQVELAPRLVRIHEIDVARIELPEVEVVVRCSTGTYIRAIARDLGAALGVGGHLTFLRRTSSGPFTLAEARTLSELGDEFSVLPLRSAARMSFPAHDLDPDQARAVGFGRPLPLALPYDGPVALFAPDGDFLALYRQAGDIARPVAVFV